MVLYHLIQKQITLWSQKKDAADEAAAFLFRALRSLLLYVAVAAIFFITLDLLELLDPLRSVLSFPVVTLGQIPLSLWVLIKAAFIIAAFILFSRIFRAWLDYKVYPALSVEEGLAYAINTFLNYFLLAIGVLFSLRAVRSAWRSRSGRRSRQFGCDSFSTSSRA